MMRQHHRMRTTLDIDDDVLLLAKELAAKEKRSAGAIISTLARQGLHHSKSSDASLPRSPEPRVRNGIRMLPRRQEPVSLDHVRRLMDDEGL